MFQYEAPQDPRQLTDRFSGRVLTQQYDLAVQRDDADQAARVFARLVGLGLRKVFGR